MKFHFYMRGGYYFNSEQNRKPGFVIDTEDYGLSRDTWEHVLITNGKQFFDLCKTSIERKSDIERLESILCKPNGELDFSVTGMRKDYHTQTLDIFVNDITYAKLLLEVNL